MPELPEVETVLRALKPRILGSIINATQVLFPTLRFPIPPNLGKQTANRKIIDVKRRAKYLLLELCSGQTIVVHLGMTGRLTVKTANHIPIKHDHVIIDLGANILVYNDPRRFGMIDLIETSLLSSHKYLCNLGPEPLEFDFTAEYLIKALKTRQVPIKCAIMDNKILVGVGNIYASEALFLARISPLLQANSLSITECELLVASIKKVLQDAIASGGSSIRDFVSADDNKGYFQHNFAVYGKAAKSCRAWDASIVKIYQSGRATFFCPNCQV